MPDAHQQPPAARATSGNPELRDFDDLADRYARLAEQVRRVVLGQHGVVEHLLVSLFCQGHTLLIGVPGLAKTLLVRTLASSLHLDFKRIQFTPDMMPSDILGAEILQTDPATGERVMRYSPGPIFANIVLADEVNRASPKTQAALLEAMAERQVSVGGRTRTLDPPFVVVATQNPIEQEGTYPLPEAQLDRFMFALRMDYPRAVEERSIAEGVDDIAARAAKVAPLFDAAELIRLRAIIGRVPVSEHVVEYAVNLARATRPDDETCPQQLKKFIAWGAGPRAGQVMVLAARCLAALEGQPTPGCHHVQRIAPAALRHRLVLTYAAGAEGVDADAVVERLIKSVPQPSYE